MAWPPRAGELWLAMDRWTQNGGFTIEIGDALLIVNEPLESRGFGIEGLYRIIVLGPQGSRSILASPGDITAVSHSELKEEV